jgi:hypothetical protein
MAWMELHQEFYDHPKVRSLARNIRVPIPTAKGYIVNLWLYCVKFAQDGDITDHITDLPSYMEVPEKPGYNIIKSMIAVGLLDENNGRVCVHDWKSHGIRLLKQSKSRLTKHRRRKDLGTKSETFQKRISNVLLTYLSDLSYLSTQTESVMRSADFAAIYTEWGLNRIQAGKPLTDIGIRRQLMFLANQQDDPIAIVRQSLERQWQGLFPIKKGGAVENNQDGIRVLPLNSHEKRRLREAARNQQAQP